MRNLAEPLIEIENIINYNLDVMGKIVELSKTTFKENEAAQDLLMRTICIIWENLRPVHQWIRDQNQPKKEFFDELDRFIAGEAKPALDVKNLVPNARKQKKGKK
jgi:hypothetical protein